jgi:hypothetical protein
MLRLRTVLSFTAIAAMAALGTARADDDPPAAPGTAQPTDDHTHPPYEAAQPADATKTTTTTTTETTNPPPANQPVIVQPAPAPVVVETPAAPAPVVTTTPVVVEEQPVNVYLTEPKRSRMMTLSVGGGLGNFSKDDMQGRTGMSAAYEARLAIGTNSIFGVEIAYVGTAAEIQTLGLDDDAMLISNGGEGLARLNLGTFDFQPYVVGGASWVRYNVVNESFNTSDVRGGDDVLAIPFGGGISTYLGQSGLVLDGRFTYRATFDDELVRPTSGNSDGSDLSNWMATLRLGYNF